MRYNIISPSEEKEEAQGKRHHIRKVKIPSLWMQTPDKYPQLLESFRTFSSKIFMFQGIKKLRIFLLTGADDKVGTSTITFNLGIVLSRMLPDCQILIVDTNIERPSLHIAFRILPLKGLMDYISRKAALFDIIHRTFILNLDIVPLGAIDNKIFSPFNMPLFVKFLEEVRGYYDIILIDSSPALKSSHTKIISSKVDGVIIVAEANQTRFEVLEEVVQQLKAHGANILGNFLNKRKYVIPKWIYRYIF